MSVPYPLHSAAACFDGGEEANASEPLATSSSGLRFEPGTEQALSVAIAMARVDIPAAKRLRAWPGAGPQQGHHRHHARFGLPVVDAPTRPNWLTSGPRRHFGNTCFSGHPRLRPDNGCVTGRPRPLLDHCASAPLRPHSPYWSSNARLGQIWRTGRPGFTSATSASPVGHRRVRQLAFVALPRGHVEPRCHGSRRCSHRQIRQPALVTPVPMTR